MARIGIKNSIGGLHFDAVFKVDHTSKLTMTSHPVEHGANITDHSFIEPNEVSLEIGMSDVAISADGYRAGGRSVSTYKALRELQAARQPITVVTRLHTYRNMLIESITAPDDYTTMFALRATVMLREIIIVSTQTVKVSPRNTQTNAGAKQPVSADTQPSVLKQAVELLKGGS